MNPVIKYDPNDIVRIWDVDHPESISVEAEVIPLDNRADRAGADHLPSRRRIHSHSALCPFRPIRRLKGSFGLHCEFTAHVAEAHLSCEGEGKVRRR